MNLLYIDRPLVINPALAEKIGLNEAIILQQLNYWLTRTDSGVSYDGVQWVYNTYSDWQEQAPFFSERTIQRIILKLEKIGIVRSEMLRKSKGDRTKFYTINQSHELLALSSRQDGITITTDCLDHSAKMAPPSCQNGTLSTETTTETTHTLKTLSSKPDVAQKKQRPRGLDYSSWPELPDKQILADWLDLRKRLRAGVSQTVINRFGNELTKAAQHGYTVDQCLTEVITRGWRGFEAQWLINKSGNHASNQQIVQQANASGFVEKHTDRSWAE